MKLVQLVLILALLLAFPVSSPCFTVTIGDDEPVTGSSIASMILVYGEIMGYGSDWNILIAPGTFDVSPELGWPVTLNDYAPAFIGRGGADSTFFQGDGTTDAFVIPDYALPDIRMRGLTFRDVGDVLEREDSAVGSIEFIDCVIQGCASGLNACVVSGSATITGNVIENCGSGLSACEISGDAIVAHNIINGNGGWGLIMGHNFGTIEYNEVCYNTGGGVDGYCCETPTIRYNHIHHNGGAGLSPAFYLRASHNIIEHNAGVGLVAPYLSGFARWNIIRGNDVGVIIGENNSLSMECNDIYDNVSHELEVSTYSGGFTVDATMTWWGTSDPVAIAAGIWDCVDDAGIQGCVDFDPWADGPGCGQAPVRATSWGAVKALYR